MGLLGGNNLTKFSVEKMNLIFFFFFFFNFLEMNINAFCSFASNRGQSLCNPNLWDPLYKKEHGGYFSISLNDKARKSRWNNRTSIIRTNLIFVMFSLICNIKLVNGFCN
jgi:hypothetical protein